MPPGLQGLTSELREGHIRPSKELENLASIFFSLSSLPSKFLLGTVALESFDTLEVLKNNGPKLF